MDDQSKRNGRFEALLEIAIHIYKRNIPALQAAIAEAPTPSFSDK